MATWDEYYKKNLAATEEQMKKQIADSDAIFNKQNETVKSIYEGQIGEENQEYDDLSRQNEVQKYINAREVAENNANLGLTDSGLNRTQQTAVQLSASNNEAKIQRARQSAVAALTREMNAKLADIETSKLSSEASIRSGYEKMASDAATSAYKADVEAETARIKAQQEAAKSQKSEYTKLVSGASDGDKSVDTKLAELYQWVSSYDTDFDDTTYFTNSDIRRLLKLYNISETEWLNYFAARENMSVASQASKGIHQLFIDEMNRDNGHTAPTVLHRSYWENDSQPVVTSAASVTPSTSRKNVAQIQAQKHR